MTIINKGGIDSLVKARNKVVNDRLSSYKEAISTTMLHFSEKSKELENILNTFDYLENNKLEKVVKNTIFNTQFRIEKSFQKIKSIHAILILQKIIMVNLLDLNTHIRKIT